MSPKFTHSGIITLSTGTRRRVQLRATKRYWVDDHRRKWRNEKRGSIVGSWEYDTSALDLSSILPLGPETERAVLLEKAERAEEAMQRARADAEAARQREEAAALKLAALTRALEDFYGAHPELAPEEGEL